MMTLTHMTMAEMSIIIKQFQLLGIWVEIQIRLNNQLSYDSITAPGTGNLTGKNFSSMKKRNHKSMSHFKHNSSYSNSRYDPNQTVQSINGAETFLSRFSSNHNFELNHGKMMDKIKTNIEKSKNLRVTAQDLHDDYGKEQVLKRENKLLRTSLKTLNEYLNKFLQAAKESKMRKMSSISYKYGSNGRLKQSRDEKIKYRNLEAENYNKMLNNLSAEHSRVKQRLFKVQDHKYVMDLRSEIKQSKEIIDELTKKNRELKD